MDEISALTPSFGGVSHQRLDSAAVGGRGLQWPCLSADHPGTPIMHVGKFARGAGAYSLAEYRPSAELPDEEYPLVLSTGRILYHYNACAMTDKVPGLNQIANRSFIEMNQKDADELGVSDGQMVQVTSRRGQVIVEARVGTKVKPGQTWMPFHFQDGNANQLTIAALDNIAKAPEYKVCAVRVEPA